MSIKTIPSETDHRVPRHSRRSKVLFTAGLMLLSLVVSSLLPLQSQAAQARSWTGWQRLDANWTKYNSRISVSYAPDGSYLRAGIQYPSLTIKTGKFGGSGGTSEALPVSGFWTSSAVDWNYKSSVIRAFAIDNSNRMFVNSGFLNAAKSGHDWTGWSQVAGSWAESSASMDLSYAPDGKFMQAAVSSDGNVMVRTGKFGGTWNSWANLGSNSRGWRNVSADWNPSSGVIRVFAVDGFGRMFVKSKLKSGWNSWKQVSKGIDFLPGRSMSLSYTPDGRFLQVAVGYGGALVRTGKFGGTWNSWGKLTHPSIRWSQAAGDWNPSSGVIRVFGVEDRSGSGSGDMYVRSKL